MSREEIMEERGLSDEEMDIIEEVAEDYGMDLERAASKYVCAKDEAEDHHRW